MGSTTMALMIGVMALVAVVTGIPSYYYPNSWGYKQIQEFLQAERINNAIRPREVQTFNTDNQGVGMVSGIDVDSQGHLFVFHRADRPWLATTFQPFTNELSSQFLTPIEKDTIVVLDPITGRNISSFGADLFNVPHGLSLDKDDNVWVTDVGRHQVLRIPSGSSKPDLELGVKFVPGSDDLHFCKPTDVAIASNGEFFVADGYCNHRVMKFASNGTLITKWGTASNQGQADGPDPYNLDIVHSLTLVEEEDLICVADREHQRAMCYNAGLNSNRPVGAFNKTLIPEGEMGKVFALHYNKAEKTVIAAAEIARGPVRDERGQWSFPARAYTYGLDGNELVDWAFITPRIAERGPSLIHDISSSNDGKDFFLADMTQQKIYKYTIRRTAA